MKRYESQSNYRLEENEHIIVRLDGNSFSKLSKNIQTVKPFDERFSNWMVDSTKALLEYCSASSFAYTQSDEITLVINKCENKQSAFLGNRVQKMCSLLASVCSVAFNKSMQESLGDNKWSAHFDARVFSIPSNMKIYNAILWRQRDCFRNAIFSYLHYNYGGKRFHGVSTEERIKFMVENGDWNKLENKYLYGIKVTREKMEVDIEDIIGSEKFLKLSEKFGNISKIVNKNYFQASDMENLLEENNRINFIKSYLEESSLD